MTRSTPLTKRSASAAMGVAYLVTAAASAVIVFSHDRLLMPVTLDLPGAAPGAADPTPLFEFSHVDLGLAVLVMLTFSGVMRFMATVSTLAIRARWIDYGLVAPITVFLVAQFNGITDAGALIAIYALTSAMVLFDLAQLRSHRISATSPWGLGRAVGIVPWGIIALHQVGGGLAGYPAPVIVQVVTISVLLLSAATSYGLWRENSGRATATINVLLTMLTTVVFAVEVGVAVIIR